MVNDQRTPWEGNDRVWGNASHERSGASRRVNKKENVMGVSALTHIYGISLRGTTTLRRIWTPTSIWMARPTRIRARTEPAIKNKTKTKRRRDVQQLVSSLLWYEHLTRWPEASLAPLAVADGDRCSFFKHFVQPASVGKRSFDLASFHSLKPLSLPKGYVCVFRRPNIYTITI